MANEIQQIDISGTEGIGTVTIEGPVTTGTAGVTDGLFNEPSELEAAFIAAYGGGGADVEYQQIDFGIYTIEFLGSLANTNVAEAGVNWDGSGASPSVTTIQQGSASGPAKAVLSGLFGSPLLNSPLVR